MNVLLIFATPQLLTTSPSNCPKTAKTGGRGKWRKFVKRFPRAYIQAVADFCNTAVTYHLLIQRIKRNCKPASGSCRNGNNVFPADRLLDDFISLRVCAVIGIWRISINGSFIVAIRLQKI